MEEGKKRYTPVFRGESGAIFEKSDLKCPFAALDGLDYAPFFGDMFEDAYANTFLKRPLEKEGGFGNIFSLYSSYRNFFRAMNAHETEDAGTKSMFVHNLDGKIGKEALARVAEICSIPEKTTVGELAYAVRQWNLSFYSFRRTPHFDLKGRKAIVIIRTRPSVSSLLSASLSGVERAFRKMAEEGTYTFSSLLKAVAGVKDEIREEIGKEKEKMEKMIRDSAEGKPDRGILTRCEDRIEFSLLKIRRAEITLDYLDAFVRQTEDYLGSRSTQTEPLSKRILSDALLAPSLKWEADAPGFLTEEDIMTILSDRRLMYRDSYGDSCTVYLKETRPLAELHDAVMKGE